MLTAEEQECVLQRLRRLEDIEAAKLALQRYARAIDQASLADVLPLFSRDAVLLSPLGRSEGIDAIADFFRTAWSADPSVKRHFVIDQIPTWIAPGQVKLLSYFIFLARSHADSVIGWGEYEHLVDVTEPETVFRELKISIDVATDLRTGWQLPPAAEN